ncbi:polynucleotide kinase 3'-phosphatase [Coprinopsis sp. MPI-PUGE-AT-0042]|nr:polynucleotide kinase 3'-phosphatase [Coprinopsis sp. MPI-PUGE-AT-0042]
MIVASEASSSHNHMDTKKRKESDDASGESSSASKIQKVHPFFQKKLPVAEEPGPFKWLPSLGPKQTCLHATYLDPPTRPKVAAFDLDGTIIKGDVRNQTTDWQWWSPLVPKKIREVHDAGYSIVIISNQFLKPLPLKTWREKVKIIAGALDVPLHLFAATGKDQYRKPMPGMWEELEAIFSKDGVTIDQAQSFFIGDAAGRIYSKTKSDFSSTDRKWALNVGIPFQTPEEYFLNLPPHPTYDLPGFNVSTLPELPQVLPTSSSLLPNPPVQEIVLFVGPPCVGKTTFYKQHFRAAGYLRINQDTLKTRPKCIAAVLDSISNNESCVVDNTNRDVATRKFYTDVARKHKIPIRCFFFQTRVELCLHNNLYRAFIERQSDSQRRELLAASVIHGFFKALEEPNVEEGFSEVRRVNWEFQGSEEDRKRWSMWLHVEGK